MVVKDNVMAKPTSLSFIEQLTEDLKVIETLMVEILDASTIKRFRNDPSSGVFIVAPEYYWGEPDERQQLLQMKLKKQYLAWHERFQLLFEHAVPETRKRIEETHKFVLDWIEQNSSWEIEPTIPACKQKFQEKIGTFFNLLNMLNSHGTHELVLVPDTNALIAVPDLGQYTDVAGSATYTIVIVPTVTSELDKLKVIHRDNDFREKVNSVIRRLKGLRAQGSMLTGVTINKSITARMVAHEPNFTKTLSWLDSTNDDDRIIASVLEIQCADPSACVMLVTFDINLQNKAEMAGLPYNEPPTK